MKALVIDHPGRIIVTDVERPVPSEFEALVKMRVCGICNSTDTNVIDGRMPYHNHYPAILGHESVGEVVAVGSKCTSIRPGMRFTRACALYPGEIRSGVGSAWGGFAEYGIVRDRLALAADGQDAAARGDWVLRQCQPPPGISDLEAALAISLSEIADWTSKLGSLEGKKVVVIGTGIAGLAMMWFAKHRGATRVAAVGRREERLAKARTVGADETFLDDPANVGLAREALGGGADLLLEGAGTADGLARWLPSLGAGGKAALYGMSEGYQYHLNMLAAPANFSLIVPQPEEHKAYGWVCDLILRKELNPAHFISHQWRWPDEVLGAYDAVRRREVVKGFVVFP